MKYVMFKRKKKTLVEYIPVIFPNSLVHTDIAKDMLNGQLKGCTVHSAGDWCPITCTVSGNSTTLKKKHDPWDSRRISHNDYGAQFE